MVSGPKSSSKSNSDDPIASLKNMSKEEKKKLLKKLEKLERKEKKKKKKDKAYDVDKDIDTSELPVGGASPRPSPKKSPLSALSDKEKAKKLKKKFLSTLKPISMKR